MAAAPPEPPVIVARRDMILDRLERLEVQVRALMTSQTVEAKEFVVRDEIRARLEMREYAPCLTFFPPPSWTENMIVFCPITMNIGPGRWQCPNEQAMSVRYAST